MFGIGPTELIIILVIALLVLGPKRLPELASGLGKGLAEFRRATADINAELDDARRTVEEQTREAARAAQPERRVSRTQRVMPKPGEAAAATAAAASDPVDPTAAAPVDPTAADSADSADSEAEDTDPKAPA